MDPNYGPNNDQELQNNELLNNEVPNTDDAANENVDVPNATINEASGESIDAANEMPGEASNDTFEEITLNEETEYETADEHKRRMGFGAGLGFGTLIGIFATAMISVIIIAAVVVNSGRALTIGSGGVSSVNQNQIIDEETANKLDEIMSYVSAYYYFDYDEETMRNEILHAMVEGLEDKYSVYYTQDEYADLMISTSGTYAGIGAGLKQDEDTKQVTITKVYEGTPSEEAGLLADDVILYVEDLDCTTEELTNIVSQIRGEEGTTVHLTIYRPSTDETFEVDVERRQIELPSVSYQMLPNNIGYIQISEFQSGTPEQFKAALDDLESQGMESMIVDLRDNPGGLLDSVVSILDIILPEGTVVYTEDKYGNRYDYTSDANCIDFPMVVLVNENSASASEIFAGAIKDYQYGTLIGTTTFGKGIVQSIFTLSDGDGLKITTSAYFTPNGVNIHGTGITPDIELEYEFLGTEDQTYDISLDNQLIYAQEYLTN